MSYFYSDPAVTPLADGLTTTFGTELNNRFSSLKNAVINLHRDVSQVVIWTFGGGRLIKSDVTENPPTPDAGRSIRLNNTANDVKYFIEGEPFYFLHTDAPYLISTAPASQPNLWGFLSKDPTTGLPTVQSGDWLTAAPTTTQLAAYRAAGKPCIGKWATGPTSITASDLSICDVVQDYASLYQVILSLINRIEVLEAGAGGGGGGGGGAAYASVLQFEPAGVGNDTRMTNTVVRDYLAQAKAYTDDQLASGGQRLSNTWVDVAFNNIAALWRSVSELHPYAVLRSEVAVIDPGITGDGSGEGENWDMGGTLPKVAVKRVYDPRG